MLDCKHVGPSLPPWLFCGRGLGPHSKLGAGGRKASIGIGLERSRTRMFSVGRGEGPGTLWPTEHSWAELVLGLWPLVLIPSVQTQLEILGHPTT